jgi:hypothetical protein
MTTQHDALRMARETLEHICGCFKAVQIDGLTEALAETSDEHLKDLVQRRLLYDVPDTALEAIAAIDAALQQAPVEQPTMLNEHEIAQAKQEALTKAYKSYIGGAIGTEGFFNAAWDAAIAASTQREGE